MSDIKLKNIFPRMIMPLMSVGIFIHWFFYQVHMLSYQEQYQLFLWKWDYFVKSASEMGGIADYISDFLVQFNYVGWLGALIQALLSALLSCLVFQHIRIENDQKSDNGHQAMDSISIYLLSVIPSIMVLWLMSDENSLLTPVISLILSLAVSLLMGRRNTWYDIVIVPLLLWAAGPVVWVYVLLRCIHLQTFKSLWAAGYLVALQLTLLHTLLLQWPVKSVIFGIHYYRTPNEYPEYLSHLVVIPLVLTLLPRIPYIPFKKRIVPALIGAAALFLAYGAVEKYNGDKHFLIKQDYQIRNEKWNELIQDAEKHQIESNFFSGSVNLALAMTGQLAYRQFEFYQSGGDALIMPIVRNLTSNLPSMEAFFRLGMVNESLRYAYDLQESILNGKKSGRLMKRIIECLIINGKYEIARKYLDILRYSTFYSSWAKDAYQYLGNEEKINSHPLWGRQRSIRFKDDFLYNYYALDKMFAILFQENNSNRMALEYFMSQTLLTGDMGSFMNHLGWAQKWGGYHSMPYTYQDAINCIQSQGNVPGSLYGQFARRMINNYSKPKEEEESRH